jgi:hypothetical protein
MAELLIEVFSDVLHMTTEQQDPTTSDQQIREVLEREGGAAHLCSFPLQQTTPACLLTDQLLTLYN